MASKRSGLTLQTVEVELPDNIDPIQAVHDVLAYCIDDAEDEAELQVLLDGMVPNFKEILPGTLWELDDETVHYTIVKIS